MVTLDHIGIAVTDLEAGLSVYTAGLGLELAEIEEVQEQGVRVAMLPLGEGKIELLEPTSPGSPIARFLEKKGPGIHHLALLVEDVAASLEKARQAGLELIDEIPRRGAGGSLVAFVHPRSTGGVLVEFCQRLG